MKPYLDGSGTSLRKRFIVDRVGWTARYGERIPVVTLDDRVILEGRPDEARIAAAMNAAGFTAQGRRSNVDC